MNISKDYNQSLQWLILASKDFDQGLQEDGIEKIRKFHNLAKDLTVNEKMDAMGTAAQLLEMKGQVILAIESYEMLIDLATKQDPYSILTARDFVKVAILYGKAGRDTEKMESLGKAKFIYEKLKESDKRLLIPNEISHCYSLLDQCKKVQQSEYLIKKNNYHKTLAKYFSNKTLYLNEITKNPNIRKFNEEPWQLYISGNWQDLTLVLVSPDYFYLMIFLKKKFEWMNYWQELKRLAKEDKSITALGIVIDIPDLYRQSFSKLPLIDRQHLIGTLGQFLNALGFHSEAIEFLKEEKKYFEKK